MPNDAKESFHCLDKGQGFDHRCVEFSDGMCSREIKCRFHLSPLLAERVKSELEKAEMRIRREIKADIEEKIDEALAFLTLGRTQQ